MRKARITPLAAVLPAVGGFALLVLSTADLDAQTTPDYSSVASIFSKHCVLCHNGPAAPNGLRLDSYQAIKEGSKNGPVANSGDAAASELVKRIRGDCLLYTSPSPRDGLLSRMPSSA